MFCAYNRECGADVMCCRFSQDGSHLAVGLCDGSIKVCPSCQPLLSKGIVCMSAWCVYIQIRLSTVILHFLLDISNTWSCVEISVSRQDELKGSLGPYIEILKGPFQILRVPILSYHI